MELFGTVESLIFRNAENGYSVINVFCKRMVTCVGIFPPITEGETVYMQGEYGMNRIHGEQFQVASVQVSAPRSKENIIKYLASGLFHGVGEKTATAIVDYFGDKTFEIIEFTPLELAKVRGVSHSKAESMGAQFSEFKQMQNAIIFLQQYNISLNLALKIYKQYEGLTEQIIKNNPYKMIEDVDGVGFATSDTLAIQLGFELDSRYRISAAVVHALKESASVKGHTYLPITMLIKATVALLNMEEDRQSLIENVIDEMQIEGTLVLLNKHGGSGVMLNTYYNTEKSIAKRMAELLARSSSLELNLEKEIAFYEKQNKVELHETQKQAITAAVNSGCVVISGGPGTGKTTIIKCIINILRNQGYSFVLTAPTGRAAKRMSEATGEDARTIHRLLDLDFKGGKGYFTYNDQTRLPADVVIADEISMADEYIFNALIKSIAPGGRLILVGDKDQLPSVGAGNVLSDIIESGIIPVISLTHIYRQSADSHIVTNAHMINKGIVPEFDNKSADFFYDSVSDPELILQDVIGLCTGRVSNYFKVKSDDIQVLAPLKKGPAGVLNLNIELQKVLNPPSYGKKELIAGERLFREGDRVIHTVNNYQLPWYIEDNNGTTAGEGVYNGDIGRVIEVNRGEVQLKVKFEDGKTATYSAGEFDQLALAYAVSVHKSQGSEFPVAVVVISRYNPIVTSRNLIYTAITRAKRAVVLVGDRENIAKIIKNNYTEKRFSALAGFLKEEAMTL